MKMYSKLVIFALVFIISMSFIVECKYIPNEDQTEGEYDPEPPQRRGGRMSRRFTAWMNFIGSFWREGNWDQGGPPDFAKFVGEQVHKLVKMLDEDKKKR